jgi:hypothetical protein
MNALAKATAVLLTVGALSGLPGCRLVTGAATGAGTATYIGGDLEGSFEASPERIVQVSQSSLTEMDIKVISADATGVDGRVIGRSALNKKIEISVNREGDTTSKIAIRVDTFGDEALSRQIFDKIRSKL